MNRRQCLPAKGDHQPTASPERPRGLSTKVTSQPGVYVPCCDRAGPAPRSWPWRSRWLVVRSAAAARGLSGVLFGA